MKKIIILALASAILAFSCRDDEAPEGYGMPAMGAFEAAIDGAGPQVAGFSLLVNANFYLLYGEDTGDETTWVRWVAPQMSLGEPVLLGEAVREMTFSGNPPDHGRRFSFIEARRQTGPSGFAFPHQVAAGSIAAVVYERAALFTGPALVNVTGTILSRGTVVVYDPETASGGFVRVRGFDYGRGAFVTAAAGYVRADALSSGEADVQSAILLRTALQAPAAQAARREMLLSSALLTHPDSAFYGEIFEALHPGAAEAAQAEAAPEDGALFDFEGAAVFEEEGAGEAAALY